ncbi:hypothetical protein H4R35_005944 [Dimargaris xerosporica]|nr:hypothetical protein H4R35_005944 [Dimargaris xerosporica]
MRLVHAFTLSLLVTWSAAVLGDQSLDGSANVVGLTRRSAVAEILAMARRQDKNSTSSEESPTDTSKSEDSKENSKSDKPSKSEGDSKASNSEDSSNGSDENEEVDEEDDGQPQDMGRVQMIIPPSTVATPRFPLDSSNITFEWKYKGLTDPPESITVSITVPAPDDPSKKVTFDIASNLSSSETKIYWDSTKTKPNTISLPASDQYKLKIYDSELGVDGAQTNLGSLSQYTMPFAMYRSSYDDPNSCQDCIIANDNYNTASDTRSNVLAAFALVSLTSLCYTWISV